MKNSNALRNGASNDIVNNSSLVIFDRNTIGYLSGGGLDETDSTNTIIDNTEAGTLIKISPQ